ncbi:three-helix bundle dimerization domain-containing protein [Streptomyces sp. BoleA5]|uniref:arsenate reductase/protein-tyrosine-phosphatase family protein n=1 Tax=Streptomyces sp. BoleA5 TaxID=1157637 RepID=UPI00036A5925|nr:low molecular weight phosphatase family protein [Streptomyces sp. SID8377]
MPPVPLGPSTPPLRNTDPVLVRITRDMAQRYTGVFAPETVAYFLEESLELLSARAAITIYLPVIAERFATERLDALARSEGLALKSVPEVLFVCTENSGRSQLAAALLRRGAAGAVCVHSAGTLPSAWIDPVAQRLLDELGLSPDEEFPKPLTREVIRAADIVITLGCGDACPVISGRRYVDWNLPDLKGLDLESARAVRDALAQRIARLAQSLAEATGITAPPAVRGLSEPPP